MRSKISPDEVHLWSVPLTPSPSWLDCFASTLSRDERERADRFRFPQDRDRFIVGRGVLRDVLGSYLDEEASRLGFDYNPQGRPALSAGFEGSGIRFNLSHSGDLALLVIAHNRDVGVDLEQMRPVSAEDIAGRYFGPSEKRLLREASPQDRIDLFFRLWTAKEAFLKAKGVGFKMALDSFEIGFKDDEPHLSISSDPREATQWSFKTWKPDPSYVASIAVQGLEWRWKSFAYEFRNLRNP